MSKSIAKFDEFKTENVYVSDENGNIKEKDTYFYKDFYPEKYGYSPDSVKFVYIIKHYEDKKMIIKDDVSEDIVKKITELVSNDLQVGQMDRAK